MRALGPYELISPLATGGMAEIFVARTAGIGGFEKHVALKVIHPNFSSDPAFVQMLVEEAKISVELQHANIVQTYDLGCVDDEYYIAMELIDGVDLFKLLRRASEKNIDFPFDVAAFIAREMCAGLDYAHRRNDSEGQPMAIIHRDVSPQNVLVSREGEVKIVDFGIAKAALRANQTEAGVIKGKYYYMSPEQAFGEKLDTRTDVFSTGIVLYEMIVGQMLYLDDDMERLLEKVRKARISPPSTKRPKTPIALERIAMKALRARREERWSSSGELGAALSQYLKTTAPTFSRERLAEFVANVLGDKQTNPSIQKPQARDELPPDEHSLLTNLPIAEPEGGASLVGDPPDHIKGDTTAPETRRRAAQKANPKPLPSPSLAPAKKPIVPVRTANEETRPAALPRISEPAGLQYDEEEQTIVDYGNETLLGERAVTDAEAPRRPGREAGAPTSELRVPGAGAVTPGEKGEEETSVDRLNRAKKPTVATARPTPTPTPAKGRGREPTDSTRPAVDMPRRGAAPVAAATGDSERTNTNESALANSYADPDETREMAEGFAAAPKSAQPQSTPLPVAQPLGSAYGGNVDRVPTGSSAIDLRGSRWSFAWVLAAVAAFTGVTVGIILSLQGGAPLTGAVQIVSAPPGAEVRIDGIAAADRTPLILHNVDTRRPHQVSVAMSGFDIWESTVTFTNGASEVHLQAILAPLTGRLEVTTVPPGAELIINSQVRGQTPATIDHLPRNDDIIVELRLRGYRAVRRTIAWNGQRAVALTVPLERSN